MNYNDVKNIVIKTLSDQTEFPQEQITEETAFNELGIESIIMISITNDLENYFGELPKTLFFEYENVSELIGYLHKLQQDEKTEVQEDINNNDQTTQSLTDSPSKIEKETDSNVLKESNTDIDNQINISKTTDFSPIKQASNNLESQDETQNSKENNILNEFIQNIKSSGKTMSTENTEKNDTDNAKEEKIAIIGMSGRFADANNIEEYYQNLKNGKDSIREIPKDAWDWSQVFESKENITPGKTYSKWGGYMDDIDKFDPLFFKISNKEANSLDPQERVFLETAIETLENAGYTPESIDTKMLGVFVGVMWGQYQLYGAEDASTGSSYSSIANRVSYFLNAHGPSLAVDTMCSSSLTSLHLAISSILRGESDIVLAGGVNITVHPNKYFYLSKTGFASTDGRCRSFGINGDGYVPGDGSGAVLLKKLSEAEKDGDHIYGVILASGINHSGKTSGFTVPSLESQYNLIHNTLKKAHIKPTNISYMEMHGTGTSLGDPIEIRSMQKNFDEFDLVNKKIPIGSVKSNIGHLESAAGIAALIKVLLQMEHKQIFPSLHSETLNPNINFQKTAFDVNQDLKPWNISKEDTRIASISAFGAGGSNAFLLISEYKKPRASMSAVNSNNSKFYFPFSAQSKSQLKELLKNTEDYFIEYKKQQEEEGNLNLSNKLNYFFSLCNFDHNMLDDETTLLDLSIAPNQLKEILSDNDLNKINEKSTISMLKDILTNEKIATVKNNLIQKFVDSAYTLEKGRTSYSYRHFIEATNYEELIDALKYADEANFFNVKNTGNNIDKEYLRQLEKNENYSALRNMWSKGANVNLQNFSAIPVEKTSLPTYPFLKESCWFNNKEKSVTTINNKTTNLDKLSLADVATKNYDETISTENLQKNEIQVVKTNETDCFIRLNNQIPLLEIIDKIYYILHSNTWEISDIDNFKITGNSGKFVYLINSNNNLFIKIFPDDPDNAPRKSEEMMSSNAINSYQLVEHQIEGIPLNKNTVVLDCQWNTKSNLDLTVNNVNLIDFKSNINNYLTTTNILELDLTHLGVDNYLDEIASYKEQQLKLIDFIQTIVKFTKQHQVTTQILITISAKDKEYFSFLIGLIRALNKEISTLNVNLLIQNDDIPHQLPKDQTYSVVQQKSNGSMFIENLEKSPNSLTFENRPNIPIGIYILIGGSGNVGKKLTKILTKVSTIKVIWIGRKNKNEVNIPEEVDYFSCDISNLVNLQNVLEHIINKYGHIESVWDLAMDFSINRVLKLDSKEIENSLNSKVIGSLNILEAINNVARNLINSIVFFSSAEAYIGNVSWGLYSASSLEMNESIKKFIDSHKSLPKTSVINWGFWKNDSIETNKELQSRGINPIDAELGLDVILYSLNNNMNNLIVMNIAGEIDKQVTHGIETTPKIHEVNNLPKKENKHNLISANSSIEAAYSSSNELLSQITKIFSDVLDIDASKLDIDVDIANYGVDSIMLTSLSKKFKEEFQNFPEQLLIENSTIQEITNALNTNRNEHKVLDSIPNTTQDVIIQNSNEFLPRVIQIFSDVLDIDASKLETDIDIANYGVDSIMLTSLSKKFKEEFQNFSEQLLIENSTIQEIANALESISISMPSSSTNNSFKITILDNIENELDQEEFFIEYHDNLNLNSMSKIVTINEINNLPANNLKRYNIESNSFDIEIIEKGKGDPLLLIPAVGLTAPTFINQFKKLSQNYRVICIHAPGYGISTSKKQPNNDELAYIYNEILSFITNEQVNILASCFGTILGVTLTAQYPKLVKSLVLVGGFYDGQDIQKIDTDNINLADALSNVSQSIGYDFENLISKYPSKDASTLRNQKEYLLNATCSNPLFVIRYLNELESISNADKLKKIKVPTLIMYGTDDTVIPNKRSIEMIHFLSNAGNYIFDKQGHYPYLTDSDTFNKQIDIFLKGNY